MSEEGKSYPMLERKVRNPVIKERFEDRMIRYAEEHRGCSSMGERRTCTAEVAGSTPVSSIGDLDEMENKKKSVKKKN